MRLQWCVGRHLCCVFTVLSAQQDEEVNRFAHTVQSVHLCPATALIDVVVVRETRGAEGFTSNAEKLVMVHFFKGGGGGLLS